VNKNVAEKAMAVKADELIRKPFQPQDLIVRVKSLLNPKPVGAPSLDGPVEDSTPRPGSQVLTSLFSQTVVREPVPASAPARLSQPPAPTIQRATVGSIFSARPEIQKLRSEILRLELLVKKLQAELEAQREYSTALEAHFKSLQEGA
jgi:hypothetical protein